MNVVVELGGDDDLAGCVTQQAAGAAPADSKLWPQGTHVDESCDAGPERAVWEIARGTGRGVDRDVCGCGALTGQLEIRLLGFGQLEP